jgi:subtilisin-like proprotein convertase family protein
LHPNDPLYAEQWHLTVLGGIETVWNEYSGAGITIGVYDGGVQTDHPDMAANYDASLEVEVEGSQLDGDPSGSFTGHGHGTAVAAVIVATGNNGLGGVGVAWGAHFASVPIMDPGSPASINGANYATGFYPAMDQMSSFDVSNHSWTYRPAYDPLSVHNDADGNPVNVNWRYQSAAINGRGGLGTINVQGVGNDNLDAQGSGIGVTRHNITVAGTQQDGFAASFSSYGACVLVTAPSTLIVTADMTGTAGYDEDDYFDAADNAALGTANGLYGTSFSGPMVTGIVALMLDANPNLGWRDVQNILAVTARHTGSAIGASSPGTNENSAWFINRGGGWNGGGMHFSNDYGYGLVDARAAVRLAESWLLFDEAQTSANEVSWNNWNWGGDVANVGIDLPDQGSFTDSLLIDTINGTGGGYEFAIEHVTVTLKFTHPNQSELRLYLISPEGTEVQIYDGSFYVDTTFDSRNAAQSGMHWAYGVDALRGETASGEWELRVEDVTGGNAGHLDWFRLDIYGRDITLAEASRNDTYHYTNEFAAVAALAGEASRKTLSDAGGTDWIDAAAVGGSMSLSLLAGATSKVGSASWFKIAAGTTIEHAVTGDGNDKLVGNATGNKLYGMRGNDTFQGGAGKDAINGGVGKDTADYSDKTAKVTIALAGGAATTKLGTAKEDSLTGIENLVGGSAGDALSGDGAANVLSGGKGNDTLLGGGAADRFVFTVKPSATNIDQVKDFKHDTDLLALDDAIFKGIGTKLDAKEFYSKAGAIKAHDSSDRIIYDPKTGKLYIDDDGNKAGGHAAIHFATLFNKPAALDAGDFVIV